MANITEELKQHVSDNEHIQEVYFDAKGDHYFHAYDLAGKKYARIASDLQGNLSDEDASAPFLITETLSRAEILGETIVPDALPEADKPEMAEEQSEEILAAEQKEESIEETA